MKVLEIRASLLAKDDKGKHVKHVALEITDPALCASIQAAIEDRSACTCTKGENACTCTKGQDADGKTIQKAANPRCPYCSGNGTVVTQKAADPKCQFCHGAGTIGRGIDLDKLPDAHKEAIDGKRN